MFCSERNINSCDLSTIYILRSVFLFSQLLRPLFLAGVIDLRVCIRVESREPIKNYKYVFDVCTGERTYHLSAETSEEKEEWIETLNRTLFSPVPSPPISSQVTVYILPETMAACISDYTLYCSTCIHIPFYFILV